MHHRHSLLVSSCSVFWALCLCLALGFVPLLHAQDEEDPCLDLKEEIAYLTDRIHYLSDERRRLGQTERSSSIKTELEILFNTRDGLEAKLEQCQQLHEPTRLSDQELADLSTFLH